MIYESSSTTACSTPQVKYSGEEGTVTLVSSCSTPTACYTPLWDEEAYVDTLEYANVLNYRYENAVDPLTKQIYEKYEEQIFVSELNRNDNGYYDDVFNTIEINVKKDSAGGLGRGQAYYHEVGHMVDDCIDVFGYASSDWGSYYFYYNLTKDLNNRIDSIVDSEGCQKSEAYEKILNEICVDDNKYLAVQDIIYGLGVLLGYAPNSDEFSFKHNNSYYDSDKICNEAFAHFFEAGMDYKDDKLNLIKEYFPETYGVYREIISDDLD